MHRGVRVILIILSASFAQEGFADEHAVQIPMENQEGATKPEGLEGLARRVFQALVTKNEKLESQFFPKAEFVALKEMRGAEPYYGKLEEEYDRDLVSLRKKLDSLTPWDFVGFKAGFCKWKKAGSEYNRIPYWSCYRSQFVVSNSKGKKAVEIRTAINWGSRWYVTHLGHSVK